MEARLLDSQGQSLALLLALRVLSQPGTERLHLEEGGPGEVQATLQQGAVSLSPLTKAMPLLHLLVPASTPVPPRPADGL